MRMGLLAKPLWRWTGLIPAIVLLMVCAFFSVIYGVFEVEIKSVWAALTSFDGSNQHVVIRDVRIPRTLVAIVVGISLGISGALIQALTRNPLADVGILGVNAGAALFVVFAVSFLSVSSLSKYVWFAFAGAAVTGGFVYMLGSAGLKGLSPVKVTIAGAAVGMLASSLTHAFLLVNQRTMDEVLFWLSGSVEGRKLSLLVQVLPFLVPAWLAAWLLGRPINALLLGDDVAVGLGQRTKTVKLLIGIVIIILAGGSVSIAGPILFVGLVSPHLARYLVGNDTRWVVVYSAMIGAVLLLVSDIAARYFAMPKEIPVGVMTALIGTPFFVYVARRGAASS